MTTASRIPLLLAVGLALAASACASPRTPEALAARTPADQFPFKVTQEADETMLAVHPSGLSGNQAAALNQALGRWRDAGGEAIVVRTPAVAPQERDATIMGEQVRAMLMGSGVPYAAVRLERYDAAGDPAAPVVVGFSRYRAEIPRCGEQWDNLTGTQSNGVHSNFGCAVSANMAAQVANPRDLVQARAEDPRDAARTAFQTDLYRQGQDTAAQVANDGGQVSQAIR